MGFRLVQRQVNGLKEARVGSTNRFAKRSIPEDEITFPLEWLWNQTTFPVAFEKVNESQGRPDLPYQHQGIFSGAAAE